MKARIKLDQFPESAKGHRYYGLMEDEAQYERVKKHDILYERSKRVTHYLVPASVFDRLLKLDRASEKMCGHWELITDEKGRSGKDLGYPDTYRCSCCDSLDADGLYIAYSHRSNFCPECGADLREVEEYAEDDPNRPNAK